jgi:predicted site-specific integrase-resolvase
MKVISTRQAAKELGIHFTTLAHYIADGKLPAPTIVDVGTTKLHAWTAEDLERARKLLPKIANGRKTRYQKLREKQGTQPRAAALRKKRKPKKK